MDTLLAILWKSSLVLAAGGVAALLAGRASAATRHLIWLAALSAALVLPAGALLLPAVTLAILPAAPPEDAAPRIADVPLASRGFTIAANAGQVTASAGQAVEGSAAASPTVTALPAARPGVTAPAELPAARLPPAPPFDWVRLAKLLWGSVALALLVHIAWGEVELRRIAGRARHTVDAEWQGLLLDAARRAGLTRRVDVLVSEETEVPATWGVFNPCIVIPAAAEEWPAARKRGVLVHELAHVQRLDVLTQVLARVVCALHWPNPLAWMAAAALRREREKACDDRVIAEGERASDYASSLLEVARSAVRSRGPVAALAMAHRSQLEGRLLAVLDTKLDRRPVEPRRMLRAVCVAGVLALPLAAVRAERAAPDELPATAAVASAQEVAAPAVVAAAAPRTVALAAPDEPRRRKARPAPRAEAPEAPAESEQPAPPAEPAPAAVPAASAPAAAPTPRPSPWPVASPSPAPIARPAPLADLPAIAPRAEPVAPSALTPLPARAPVAAGAALPPRPARFAAPAPPAAPAMPAVPAAPPAPVAWAWAAPPAAPPAPVAPAAPAPSAWAGSPPPPAASSKAHSRSSTHSDNSGDTTWTSSWSEDDGRSGKVFQHGKATFTDDARDLASLADGALFQLSLTEGGHETRAELRGRPGGAIERAFLVDGARRDWDQGWFSKALDELDRHTGFAAELKFPRLYREGGAAAVLAEAERTSGDYAVARYLSLLLDEERPGEATAEKLVLLLNRKVAGDYYRALILGELSQRTSLEPERLRAAFLESAKGISGDYYRAEVLMLLLTQENLSPGLATGALEAAASLEGDYYRAELLQALAQRHTVDARVFLRATAGIRSEYYRASALIALLRAQKLDGAGQHEVIGQTAHLGDHYATEVLLELAGRQPLTGEARSEYEAAARRLGESFRARALAALRR
jgi:beta-lactamase regulating signal transducer with metallopeptidase domain